MERVLGVEIELLPGSPAIVFLHEGLGSAALWRDFPARLAQATGCGALVYSRKGYGGSDPVPLPRPLTYMQEEGERELPALLARLHRRAQAWPVTDQRPGVSSLRERDWDTNDWWEWSAVDKPPPLRRAFEELREWVAAAELCVCPIHGDFHAGNVLVREGRVAGIVDWQFARRDWPALELASMVWDLCWDGRSTTIDPVVASTANRANSASANQSRRAASPTAVRCGAPS